MKHPRQIVTFLQRSVDELVAPQFQVDPGYMTSSDQGTLFGRRRDSIRFRSPNEIRSDDVVQRLARRSGALDTEWDVDLI